MVLGSTVVFVGLVVEGVGQILLEEDGAGGDVGLKEGDAAVLGVVVGDFVQGQAPG